MTRIPTLALLLVLAAAPLAAESLGDYPEYHDPPIRTTSDRLQQLVRDGVRFSSTFQALVERLDESDVIVYLQEDPYTPDGVDGHLTFLAAVAGRRYVRVRVAYLGDTSRQIAIVGHELQHAVEIADQPGVVDEASMSREYARIGYENGAGVPRSRAFDTAAAIRAGRRVFLELTKGNSD